MRADVSRRIAALNLTVLRNVTRGNGYFMVDIIAMLRVAQHETIQRLRIRNCVLTEVVQP